jgi:hypothetical protein
MLWAIIQGQTDLSETTDCVQSTDYLYTKRDLPVKLDSSDRLVQIGFVPSLLHRPGRRLPVGIHMRSGFTQD